MDNLNTITYADDWKQAYSPVYKEETESPATENEDVIDVKKKHNYGKSYLLIVQLFLCLFILLAAFGIKLFGGDLYNNIRSWYYENLNNEIIMTDNFESFDLDSIFSNEN